ncbi:hypothetical protein D3C77_756700 [compost metagenome]
MHLSSAETARGSIPFPVEVVDGNGMQLSQQMQTDVIRLIEMVLDKSHGFFDIRYFAKLVRCRVSPLHFAFDIVRKCRVVTFDTCRTQAL